jgi:hypothetical protein
MPSLETAARSLKVVPIVAPVHSDMEIETAIIALGREPGGGLVVMPDGTEHCRHAYEFAARSPSLHCNFVMTRLHPITVSVFPVVPSLGW